MEGIDAMPLTVTLSRKHQIVIPREARERLSLKPGQALLVLCKEDRIVLIPKPRDFVEKLAGLHREIWEGVDAEEYLTRERESWER